MIGPLSRMDRIRSLGIIGQSAALWEELSKIPTVAPCDVSVLIMGETGTGKELCARAIHKLSGRSHKPFVPINCGALPSDLIENELFGHESGAYTHAKVSTPGLIEAAEGGTLFLDEIDAFSIQSQGKLLRLLQEKEYRRLGETKIRQADIRVLAASNGDLEVAIREKRFRIDLHYRLGAVRMTMPPLRSRIGDVQILAHHFLQRYASEFRRQVKTIEPKAMDALHAYPWPGNVRELENVISGAVARCLGASLDLEHLGMTSLACSKSFKELKREAIYQFEHKYLTAKLLEFHGNQSHAASASGMHRRVFWELLRKHRLLESGNHFSTLTGSVQVRQKPV